MFGKKPVDVIAEDEDRVADATNTFQRFINRLRTERELSQSLIDELAEKEQRYQQMRETVEKTTKGIDNLLAACGET